MWNKTLKLNVSELSVDQSVVLIMRVLFAPVRVIIFAIVWLVTWGKLNFWLLPNLTEDVGFFDSFRPFYQCMFVDKSDEDAGTGGGDTQTAGEEEKSEKYVEELKAADEDEEADDDDDDDVENSSDENDENDADGDEEHSVGANDNGYEIVTAEDVEHGDDAAENGEDDDDGSRPTVRRRKGKRRIT